MAAKHCATNRMNAEARRTAGRHRDRQRPSKVSTWLGTGAVTLGISASLAVTPVAHAEPSTSSG